MPITFTCPSCAKTLRVSETTAGRKGRCPNCADIFTIPHASTVAEEPPARERPERMPAAARRTPAPPARDEEDDLPPEHELREDEDDFEDRPRRKTKRRRSKRGGSGLLVVGLIVGLLALLGGGGATAYFLGAFDGLFGSSGSDVTYYPDNPSMVVSINFQKLISSDLFQKVKSTPLGSKLNIQQLLENQAAGVSEKDIDRITVAGGTDDPVIILRTTRSFTPQEVLALIPVGSAKETKVGRHTIYEKQRVAFFVPEDRLLVAGELEALRKIAQRNGQPQLSPGMKAALDEADFSQTVVFAMGTGGQAAPGAPDIPAMAFGGNQFLQKIDGAVMEVNVRSDISTRVVYICKDSKAADDLKVELDNQMAQMQSMIPPALKEDMKTLRVSKSGSQVTGTMTVRGETVLNLLGQAGALFR
jgi:hypothetical protein